MSDIHEARAALEDARAQTLSTYKTIRMNDAHLVLQNCGFLVTFDLWSFDQKKEICAALNRGPDGRHMQVLSRFGYMKHRTTSKGIKFHHALIPEIYNPIVLNGDTDIFRDWPAELINQIYLYDVVLRKRQILLKGRVTRMKRMREQ